MSSKAGSEDGAGMNTGSAPAVAARAPSQTRPRSWAWVKKEADINEINYTYKYGISGLRIDAVQDGSPGQFLIQG
jgi:hypothetical protein